MSMSQEEIEALMNGLDINDSEDSDEVEVESSSVNTDEIEQLLSQTEEIKEEPSPEKNHEEKEDGTETISNDSMDDLINEVNSESTTDLVNNDEINDLLKDIELDENDDESVSEDDISDISLDELLAETTEEIEPKEEPKVEPKEEIVEPKKDVNEDEIVKNWTSNKIEEGVIPWPADNDDTRVVSQLNQVANDSEEKVGQIFDVLSLSLDNNNSLRSEIKNLNTFLEEEKKLLESLSQKFPNIGVFSNHLAEISKINDTISVINNNSFEEDSKIYEAMELMQFNDINRQKIERVMSVIRKLSTYLNRLFDDDGTNGEIAVAKHIHGDDTDDLIGDDLDKLIEDFANKE